MVALKRRAPGRGVGKLRRLLELKRTYPNEPFLAASRGEIEFLENQLLQEQARLVVVEAADMVLPLPEDLDMVCVPDRAAPYDAFLHRHELIRRK